MVAARTIKPGELISLADVKTVPYSGPLRRLPVIHDDHELAGKCAVRPIEEGTVLAETMLAKPQDVERQQIVTVHIQFGAASIETQGVAIEGGREGEVIKVRNPKSGRIFRGRINAPGVVTVVPGGEVGLAGEDKKS